MLVIVHSIVHSVGVICQNPLVICLNHTQEIEILPKCKSTQWSDNDSITCGNAGNVGMVVVGSVVLAFTILVEWHVLRISWSDAIEPHPLFSFFYPPIIFNYHMPEIFGSTNMGSFFISWVCDD
jgi:hypothetical protein